MSLTNQPWWQRPVPKSALQFDPQRHVMSRYHSGRGSLDRHVFALCSLTRTHGAAVAWIELWYRIGLLHASASLAVAVQS